MYPRSWSAGGGILTTSRAEHSEFMAKLESVRLLEFDECVGSSGSELVHTLYTNTYKLLEVFFF